MLGTNNEVILFFTLTFLAGVMFDSSMPLVRQLTGKVYLVLGWGTLVHIKFLADHAQCKWASLQGKHPHITGVWAGCKKIEMICMCQLDRWCSLHPNLYSVPCQWGGGIPHVVVQQMSDPPSDPPSRSCLWNIDPVSLVLVVRPTKMTHQGLLPWRAGSSSGHGTRWPQM